jgi:protein-disulfide isomerase
MIHVILISIFTFFSVFSLKAEDAPKFSLDQRQEIEGVIHDYLLKHPEILIQAVEVLKERQYQEMQDKAINTIIKEAPRVFASESPFIGNKDGNLFIVEFMDYNCPHCREIHDTLDQLVKENKDLKLVIKEFPVLGEASIYAAKAALAAQKQGKFQEIHDAFLNEKVKLNESLVNDIAKKLGLDVFQLQADMKKVEPELEEVHKLALSIGILSTPVLIVASYPFNEDKKVIFIPGAVAKPILEKALEVVK